MNNMNQFQPLESKLEKMGGFFGTFFMATMVLPPTIVAVFEGIGKALQGALESVGLLAAACQADKRS